MTGLGVERMPRAAYPLPSDAPAGDSTPLPPHIQGAERRSENRARHTGIRWGLRVLVVGGLAGAAWLLTGTAAQAADHADGPDGSLLGSVLGSDADSPVLGLLQAAAQPLENTRPAHHQRHIVADILDVPRQVLTRPAETDDDPAGHDSSGTTVDALTGIDKVLGEVAAPHRPTGEAAPDQRLTDEFPADDSPQLAEEEPVALPQETERETEPEPSRTPVHQAKPAPATGGHAVVRIKHGRASSAPSAHRHHRAAHAVSAEPATEQEESTPGGDGPAAPLRLHLGDVSGTPTSGSGTPTEGGSAAFLPVAIADSTMASHAAAIASDVEARRHDAEAPTVSPD
ncbi:hypothetical protein JIG36_14860 [Actinoplanes sp. LDG1-06]|uniref:Uncharacterized protein n=1 Tax=Paractinoplanes ovalisporus TaxID=2810368 RepID=A0ABS2AAH3_9ACTN|nr:hypothetical protein [Actinoplanes ovalisporus]MBM2616839.1 hypothetical protein [Actinoplanes ovalisporus]